MTAASRVEPRARPVTSSGRSHVFMTLHLKKNLLFNMNNFLKIFEEKGKGQNSFKFRKRSTQAKLAEFNKLYVINYYMML